MLAVCTDEYLVSDTAELDIAAPCDGQIIDQATLRGDKVEIRNKSYLYRPVM